MVIKNLLYVLLVVKRCAAEEDYFISANGLGLTKNLPIWHIIEDNDLSILTEKK